MSLPSAVGPLLFIAVVVGAIIWAVAKALLLDEIRGRIYRRTQENVKTVLESMTPELQAEFESEWLAELDSVKSMPFSALRFARGVRQSAAELMCDPALAPAAVPRRLGAAFGRSQRQGRRKFLGSAGQGMLQQIWLWLRSSVVSVALNVTETARKVIFQLSLIVGVTTTFAGLLRLTQDLALNGLVSAVAVVTGALAAMLAVVRLFQR
jgi:hypothetical protein